MSSAVEEFMKHCRRKNLAKATMEYYEEDMIYFQKVMQVQTTGEICKEPLENFVDHEMNKGNKITAINSRIRGLRVFFKFCADLGYCKPFKFPLIKEDEALKEPYTNAEPQNLLRMPDSDRWSEWCIWVVINTFIATGIRANTLVNIKINDVDFDHDTIFLRKLKNRRQQFIPMSKSLKEVLTLYLKLWDWDGQDFLFPTGSNTQLGVHSLQSAVRHYNLKPPSWCRIKIPTWRFTQLLGRSLVGTFPDGNSALMLVCARLRHVASAQWSNKKYMNMKHLEAAFSDASIA